MVARSRPKSQRLIAVVVMALTILVTACGGSGSSSSDSSTASTRPAKEPAEATDGQTGDTKSRCPLQSDQVSEILGEKVRVIEDQVGPNPSCAYLPEGAQSGELGVVILPFPVKDGTARTLPEARDTYEQSYGGQAGVRFSDKPAWGANAFVVTRTASDHPVGQVEAFVPGHSITVNLPVAEYDVHGEGVVIADQLVRAVAASS
jgi:hypothetical protein